MTAIVSGMKAQNIVGLSVVRFQTQAEAMKDPEVAAFVNKMKSKFGGMGGMGGMPGMGGMGGAGAPPEPPSAAHHHDDDVD